MTLRCVETAGGFSVECDVYPVDSMRVKPIKPGPYAFANRREADRFIEIAGGDHSLVDWVDLIAREGGFSCVQYLTRVFRANTGETPARYRASAYGSDATGSVALPPTAPVDSTAASGIRGRPAAGSRRRRSPAGC